MAKKSILELQSLLDTAADKLPKITSKKMFGCHALWVDGNVFALIWKHGRIGVKLPQDVAYQALLNISGAEPWRAGSMQMAHWVLVPESFHEKSADLKKWILNAHSLCAQLEKKPKKKSHNKASAKKTNKRKAR